MTPGGEAGAAPADSGGARTVLRVVRGDPTPEQLAALLVVVLSRTDSGSRRRTPLGWAARAERLGQPLRNAPGAWRTSALP